MWKWMAAVAATAMVAAPAVARDPEQTAEAALRAAPVWDGHNDVPEQIRDRRAGVLGDFDFRDTSNTADPANNRKAMHTDLARLRKGHLGAQFWSVYVDASLTEQQQVQAVLEQVDVTRRLIARYPQDMAFVTTSAEAQRAMKQGKIASLLGMEGGGGIGNSLGVLREMYGLGVRYMTLTHSADLSWADSAHGAGKLDGLSDFGRDVVREMQRLGMLVDLSHVSEATMNDTLDVAKAPVIFSHSGARAINPHPRNVPDAVLDRLKANGGIIMVYALPEYVSVRVREWQLERAAQEARFRAANTGNADAAKKALADWEVANPAPRAKLAEVADHIDYIAKRIGADHVGICGDYDGMSTTVEGLEDVSTYPALFAELARRGYSQADLEKISSRNMLRVMRAAEAYAASVKTMAPIENKVAF
jgi:membrane dipeptidase